MATLPLVNHHVGYSDLAVLDSIMIGTDSIFLCYVLLYIQSESLKSSEKPKSLQR